MRQTRVKGGYPVVVTREAKPLKRALINGVYDRILRIIDEARNGTTVSRVELRRSIGAEDPAWEQLVFDVHVESDVEAALAFWHRLGGAVADYMDSTNDDTRRQIVEMVSVQVSWK